MAADGRCRRIYGRNYDDEPVNNVDPTVFVLLSFRNVMPSTAMRRAQT